MPFIVILIILAIAGAIIAISGGGETQSQNKPLTQEEIERMSAQMIGKSKKECRRILRNYKRK